MQAYKILCSEMLSAILQTCALKVNLGSKLDDVIGERKEHK